MKHFLLFWIRAYQAGLSPLFPASCRYTPSCSEFARIAVERHGAARGAWLAVRRVARCHPFGGHGSDPVPEAEGAVHEVAKPYLIGDRWRSE